MKRFACGDVVPGCTATFGGATEDAILDEVAAHAAEAHGLTEISPDLADQVRACIEDEARQNSR